MKKILLFFLFLCFFLVGINPASAITLNYTNNYFYDGYFLGSVAPGAPADPTSEAGYINYLLSMGIPDTDTYEGHDYYRSVNDFGSGMPVATSGQQYSANSIDVTGCDYILGKFGSDSYVWYVGGLNEIVSLDGPPSTPGAGAGFSHLTVFNQNPVPEPATLLLFGSGLVGLVALKRKYK